MRRLRALTSVFVFVRKQKLLLFTKPNYPFVSSYSHFQGLPFSSSSNAPPSTRTSWNPNVRQIDHHPDHDDHDDDDVRTDYDDDDDHTDDLRNVGTQLDSEEANALVRMLLSDQPRWDMKRKMAEWETAAVSPEFVSNVLSRVCSHWEAAFAFFQWAAKQPSYSHSVREYHSMISILGKVHEFETAWAVIDTMRSSSLVNHLTLQIMIRCFSAARDVNNAIATFHSYSRFGLKAGMEEFQGLLSALCRHRHVKDAEYLLFSNGLVFPFNTKSFNIVLNGWCNVIVSPREGHRIWWEMSRRRIPHDTASFATLASCYSREGSLYKVLKVFDRMTRLGIAPNRKVYNAVVFALVKGRFAGEAVKLMRTMEEKGVPPNDATYNSLIKPLCKAGKMEEARVHYDEMVRRGITPSVQMYHGFFRALRSDKEVFALLEEMRERGCEPDINTFIMLIRKFCRWRQLGNVFKLWERMGEIGVSPDRSSYIVLIHGLFLNGELELANKYYSEMKEKQYLPEPKTEEMLQAWLSGKHQATNVQDCDDQFLFPPKELDQCRRAVREPPEARKVVRDRGFSFWD